MHYLLSRWSRGLFAEGTKDAVKQAQKDHLLEAGARGPPKPLVLYPCYTKTREVMGNPSPPPNFPRPLEGRGKFERFSEAAGFAPRDPRDFPRAKMHYTYLLSLHLFFFTTVCWVLVKSKETPCRCCILYHLQLLLWLLFVFLLFNVRPHGQDERVLASRWCFLLDWPWRAVCLVFGHSHFEISLFGGFFVAYLTSHIISVVGVLALALTLALAIQ